MQVEVEMYTEKVLPLCYILCRNCIFGYIHSWQVHSNVHTIYIKKKAYAQHKMSKRNLHLQTILVTHLQSMTLVIENWWRTRQKSWGSFTRTTIRLGIGVRWWAWREMGQGVVRMEGVATCFRDLGNILIIAIPWVYSSLSMPPFRLICSIVWQHICFLR